MSATVLHPSEPEPVELPDSTGAARPFRRVGTAESALGGAPQLLVPVWLAEYAGGIFLPFADATSGAET